MRGVTITRQWWRAVVGGSAVGIIALFLTHAATIRRGEHLLRQAFDAPHENIRGVLIFRPDDCPGSLDVIDYWNTRARNGAVLGLLIADSTEFPDWRTLLRVNHVRFPTILLSDGDAAAVLAVFGRRHTPLSVVPGNRGEAAIPGGFDYVRYRF